MIYYLVGMMGSGKTHLGKQLAERLKVPFLDLDQCIEADEERSISDIFEKEGEGHFREIEAQRLRVIADDYEAVVVATGGGTPCFHDNMVWMKQTGHTIYLKAAPELLVERLLQSGEGRPLIAGLNRHQLAEKISALTEKREPFYLQAHETVEV